MIGRIVAAGTFLIALSGAAYFVLGLATDNALLKKENLRLETQMEIIQFNVELYQSQLEEELQIRNVGEDAITELKEVVPDVDYNTLLPESIQGVLDRFHSSSRQLHDDWTNSGRPQ